jgi:8-oxo-dGTP pyrophosphatase MutT (NUDIX family)
MTVVKQAGAIVFREEGGVVRVLLVRSKKDPRLWIFPKGHIDPGEAPRIAALREAFEEAGVTGLITGPAGPALTFRSGDEMVAVDYYVVRLTAEMPSPEGREKVWLLPEEAEQRLAFENARQLLRTAFSSWFRG